MEPWHEVVSEPGSPEHALLRIGKSLNESWRVVPILPDVQLDLQFLEFVTHFRSGHLSLNFRLPTELKEGSLKEGSVNLLQFSRTGADRRIGLVEGDSVIDLSQSSSGAFSSWSALLQAVKAEGTEITEFILQKSDRMSSSLTLASLLGGRRDRPPFLLPPVEAAEVWGCGVTYLRSRDAREEETLVKGIYDRVY